MADTTHAAAADADEANHRDCLECVQRYGGA